MNRRELIDFASRVLCTRAYATAQLGAHVFTQVITKKRDGSEMILINGETLAQAILKLAEGTK